MTKLLVSVRNAVEAVAAIQAGADLIDVKEPARGSLGAADTGTIREVLHAVGGRRPVSAAFGELRDGLDNAPAEIPDALSYAKFGLAGCALTHDWAGLWRRQLNALPPAVQGVAVAYADWANAGAPDPYEIVELAGDFGCAAVLVDTFDKTAGGLLDAWSLADLKRFVDAVRVKGLLTVLGGSLTEETIRRVLPVWPDYVAVRGAGCFGGRTGNLDPERVRCLARLLNATDAGVLRS